MILVREVCNSMRIFRCQRNTTTNVLCILQTDKPRNWMMHVLAANGGEDVFKPKGSIFLIRNRMGLDSSQCRHPAGLIDVDMRLVSHDHFIATLTVNEQRQEVSHRSGWN